MTFHTNADSKATAEDARLDEQFRKNMDVVEKAVNKTTTEGVGSNPQFTSKDAQIKVTYDQLKDQKLEEYAPVIPIATEPRSNGGFDHILTPYHYEMVRQGRLCAKCLQWQDETIQTLRCRFRGKDYGCGHMRNINTDFLYERWKK